VRITLPNARGAVVALTAITLLSPGCNRKKDESADTSGTVSPPAVTPVPGRP